MKMFLFAKTRTIDIEKSEIIKKTGRIKMF